MKLNISHPETGAQKLIDIDDEKRLRPFYEKRMAQEVEADSLGDEWKGYVFRIAGGNDKQGFPMKQGILTNSRVRLLLSKGHSCYRPRRTGERKRKSVRGCIVDANLSVLSLIIRRKGETPIPGLTDVTVPRRLGPKRASKIRKLFNLSKEDDVKQYIVRRPIAPKEGKETNTYTKAPKIQRLITPQMLQHKRRKACLKQARIARKQEQQADYAKLIAQRTKEDQEKKAELARKRRSTRESQSSGGGDDVKAKKTKVEAKAAPAKEAKKEKSAAKEAKAAPTKGKAAPAKATPPAAKSKPAPAAAVKEAPKKAAAPPKEQKARPASKPAAPAAKKAASKKK